MLILLLNENVYSLLFKSSIKILKAGENNGRAFAYDEAVFADKRTK